jgi:tetratricopeptide (TPR) repeat protein
MTNRIRFFGFIKRQNFIKALSIIERFSPGLCSGADLNNLSSIPLDASNWLPAKRDLNSFIGFLYSLSQQKKYNLAFNLAYGLADKFKNESDACLIIAQICIDRGLFDLAEKYGFAAYELKKDDFRILNCCAIVLINKGEARRAKDFLLSAITISPQFPQSYLNISLVYQYLNEYEACEESLNKAISIDPNYLPALVSLAQFTLLFKRDIERYREILERIRRIDPYNKWVSMLEYQYARLKGNPDIELLNKWFQKCHDENFIPF